MKLVEFPEQTAVISKDQPEYLQMPAWRDETCEGRVICLWRLTLRERLRVLWTGEIWHHILTFRNPVQPQLLEVECPFQRK